MWQISQNNNLPQHFFLNLDEKHAIHFTWPYAYFPGEQDQSVTLQAVNLCISLLMSSMMTSSSGRQGGWMDSACAGDQCFIPVYTCIHSLRGSLLLQVRFSYVFICIEIQCLNETCGKPAKIGIQNMNAS